ncbi:MFS transporter [Rhodococcus opacus]|nr:MFS transporter [Rhodococcus opacus]
MSDLYTNERKPRIDLRMSRWSRIGVPLFVTYFVCFMDRTNIGVASPHMADELQLGAAAIGLIFSAFFWGYVLSGVPGGAWANKGHAKTLIVVCMVVIGISAGATGILHDLPLLLVDRVVLGLAEGAIFPAFAVLFLNWFPSRERALAVALTMYTIPLSAAIMAPIAGWLIDIADWRWMFIIQAIPAILVAVWLHFAASESPERDTRIRSDERNYILAHRDTATSEDSSFLKAFSQPRIWVFGFVYFLWAMGIYAITLWLPTVIKGMTGSGSSTVGILTSIPFFLATVATFFVTRMSVTSQRSIGIYIYIPLLLTGTALVIQHFLSLGTIVDYLLLVIATASIYSALAIWWTWVMQISPKNQAGAAVGFVNVCGNLGGIVGPMIIGLVATSSDSASGFYILGVAVLLAAAIVFVLHRVSDASSGDTQPDSRPTDSVSVID